MARQVVALRYVTLNDAFRKSNEVFMLGKSHYRCAGRNGRMNVRTEDWDEQNDRFVPARSRKSACGCLSAVSAEKQLPGFPHRTSALG